MLQRSLSALFHSLARRLDGAESNQIAALSASVQSLAAELGNMRTEVASLRQDFRDLRAAMLSGRQVDLVDFGQLRVFMYIDDEGYRSLAPEYKNQPCGPVDRDLAEPAISPGERYANAYEPLISTILSHYWVNQLDFTYFDIGCQYGTSAMAVAQMIMASRQKNLVYAFDPGTAGTLVPANLRLNRMQDRVIFEPVAISNHDLPAIVYSELGQSENNRIVNRDLRTESISRVVGCKRVDQMIEERAITSHLIVKLDTQGAEPEVFRGMRYALASRLVTCVSEFVPEAIGTRTDPAEWLRRLAEDFLVFDIIDNDMYIKPSHKLFHIPEERVRAFVSEVARRSPAYTDVVLVPKQLPAIGSLVERLTA
ncbi:MAG: FkbM family methyltransferase [Bryobacterales bacterium]|nr:FkbM family methyltransferase [Bryobacterales bacterium]